MFRYKVIAHDLEQSLAKGAFEDGRLPSERALMQRYGVQRNTVRRALETLQASGLIVLQPNRRPFVAGAPPERALHRRSAAHGSASPASIVLCVQRIRESTARYDIEAGLHASLSGSGLRVVHFDPLQAEAAGLPDPAFLKECNVIGAAVWAQTPVNSGLLRQLSRQLPVVLVDRQVAGFESDFVGFDDQTGGRMATEHFLALGHERIGFLAGEVGAETVNDRWLGYRCALHDAGIVPVEEWALHLAHMRKMPDVMTHGYLDRFIRQTGKPLTAVVCSSDGTAAILIAFLRATGRAVPGDVAVLGYGDLLPELLRAIGLTTIAQSFSEAGLQAGRLLLSRLNGETTPTAYVEVRLPVKLVVRSSCGGAPVFGSQET